MKFGWSRLDREEKLILSLLQNDRKKTYEILNDSSPLNIRYLLLLTAEHRITTTVIKRLLDDYLSFIPDMIQKTARLLVLQHLTADKLRKEELVKVSTLLDINGFDVTMMKGFSYDPEGVHMRNFRDVDILVEEEKIRDIIGLLQGEGYIYQGSFVLSREEKKDIEGQLEWNNQYQFQSPTSKQVIEVHTNLFERDRIRLENLTDLLDHPELYKKNRKWSDEYQCHIPSPEASLLLLCIHCSVKRSLGNNKFILRHMSDLEILLLRNINTTRFIALCQESKTAYHAAFTLSLYKIIMQKDELDMANLLIQYLSAKERHLMKRHLFCLKDLHRSKYFNRKRYNFLALFVIGGNREQRMTWFRNIIMSTKVQQENRYHTFGFKVESPMIYLTYLINPFQTSWRLFKRIFCIAGKPRQKL